MAKGIRVTVEDLETGETETKEFVDDYLLICAGSRYLAHANHYPGNGTAVLTVKTDRGGSDSAPSDEVEKPEQAET